MLVGFDGEPVMSPIEGTDLQFAVNTNWDFFLHTPSKRYFLRVDDAWLWATAYEGPWSAADKLPASFARLPRDDNWKAAHDNLPGRALSPHDRRRPRQRGA